MLKQRAYAYRYRASVHCTDALARWMQHCKTHLPPSVAVLGLVESPPLVLQYHNGKKSIKRQAVGTDGLALPGQAWRCRAKRREQALGLQRPCRGSCAQAAPGATCSKNLANATPSSSAFANELGNLVNFVLISLKTSLTSSTCSNALCHARRQDRRQLQSCDLSGFGCNLVSVILNRS